jgi:hypothetical protein
MILAIPFIFVARILSLALFVVIGIDAFYQFALMIGIFFAFFLIVWGGAIITVFKTIAWTDIFIHLTEKKGGLAKLERMAAGLRKK